MAAALGNMLLMAELHEPPGLDSTALHQGPRMYSWKRALADSVMMHAAGTITSMVYSKSDLLYTGTVMPCCDQVGLQH